MDSLVTALLSGAVCGLIAWGGVRVELRWLRRDVDLAHSRIDQLDRRVRCERELALRGPGG